MSAQTKPSISGTIEMKYPKPRMHAVFGSKGNAFSVDGDELTHFHAGRLAGAQHEEKEVDSDQAARKPAV